MGADDMLAGPGTPRDPLPAGSPSPRRCISCQVLEHADEPTKDRLLRFYEQKINELMSRDLDPDSPAVLRARITDLEGTVAALNRKLTNAMTREGST